MRTVQSSREEAPPRVAPATRIAIVVSRFNEAITERLRRGAESALRANGVAADDIDVWHVPGAFELPFAAQRVAESGRVAAVICLGCLIRGETAHFDLIATACAHGITAAGAATGVPITFGVLTTESIEQAMARAEDNDSNKGCEAALAALEMVAFTAALLAPVATP